MSSSDGAAVDFSAYFEKVIEDAMEGIVIADTEGRLLRVNGEFKRIFGFGDEDIVGRTIDDLIVPTEDRSSAASITLRVAAGEKVAFESVRQRRDGQAIPVSVIASPILVGGELQGHLRHLSRQLAARAHPGGAADLGKALPGHRPEHRGLHLGNRPPGRLHLHFRQGQTNPGI